MMPSAHICPSEGHVCICHCDGAHTSVCAAPVAVLALLPCGQPSLFRVLLAPPPPPPGRLCPPHRVCGVGGEWEKFFPDLLIPLHGAHERCFLLPSLCVPVPILPVSLPSRGPERPARNEGSGCTQQITPQGHLVGWLGPTM